MYLLQNPSSKVSLVLSGDFNSCPEFGVFKLVTEGFLPSSCEDWNSSKYLCYLKKEFLHTSERKLSILYTLYS